jgi:hypothetical protein
LNNNENNINQEEESTKEAQEWLNFASDSFVGQSLRVNKSTSLSTFTKQQINSMLLNPALNYEKLQNLSQLYLTKNGVYKRLIEYFAYILSFDTLLVPRTETSNIKNKSKMIKSFESSALYLEMLNPKTNLPIWSKELFTNGEIFLYKIQDSKSIEFKQIPNKYCLPCAKTDSVYRYVIDMQKFVSGEDATSYPKEIQKAVEMYNSDSKGKLIDGQYYEVSNKGVCFTFNGGKGGHAIPPFSSLFTDLVNLDENKTLQNQINRLENTKMIHNKIPLNKESKPIVDPELAKRYNQAIKQNLDEGIFSIVNPFESEVLNLNNNTQKTNTLVDEAISQIFNSSGVSNLIFNNNKASGEALVKSIKADVAILVNGLIIVPPTNRVS